jgi:hypothetical protein
LVVGVRCRAPPETEYEKLLPFTIDQELFRLGPSNSSDNPSPVPPVEVLPRPPAPPCPDDVGAPPLPAVEVPAAALDELALLAATLPEPVVSLPDDDVAEVVAALPDPQEIAKDVVATRTQRLREGRDGIRRPRVARAESERYGEDVGANERHPLASGGVGVASRQRARQTLRFFARSALLLTRQIFEST